MTIYSSLILNFILIGGAMFLLIMRHAQANDSYSGDDFHRPLSDLGKTTEKRVAEFLKKKGISIDKIMTSPLLRARETTKIITDVFSKATVEVEAALGNDFDENAILSLVKQAKDCNYLALVGHAPNLGLLAAHLLDNSETVYDLSKSSVLIIEFKGTPEVKKGTFIEYCKSEDMMH